MKNHVKALGLLYIAFGILGILVGYFFLSAALGHGPLPRRMALVFSTAGFGSVLAFFFMLVSIPGLIAGAGLVLERKWARPFTLVLGFLNIFNIPLGTMLGLYSIWTLTRDQELDSAGEQVEIEIGSPRVFPPYQHRFKAR